MRDKLLAEWFWTDRWMGSSAFLLPMEARGLYREMLTQAWRRGAELPNDPDMIQRAVGCTGAEWERNWPLVKRYWREEGTRLVNDTQIEVYQQSARKYAMLSAAGKRGNAKRWHGESPPESPPDSQGESSPSPSPSPSPISVSVTDSQEKKDDRPPKKTTVGRPARRVPDGFALTPERRTFALTTGLSTERAAHEWAKFIDCEFKTPHSDWDATWRNWVRTAVERNGADNDTPSFEHRDSDGAQCQVGCYHEFKKAYLETTKRKDRPCPDAAKVSA